jgi:MoxR-like ATPase
VVQAKAFLHQRHFVTPEDIQEMVVPVLGVRLKTEDHKPDHILQDILDKVSVPRLSHQRH